MYYIEAVVEQLLTLRATVMGSTTIKARPKTTPCFTLPDNEICKLNSKNIIHSTINKLNNLFMKVCLNSRPIKLEDAPFQYICINTRPKNKFYK